MSYALKTLEFNVILNEISKYAYTQTIKKAIMDLTPYKSIEQVKHELLQSNEALNVIYRIGSFALIDDFDIDSILSSLKLNRVLSITDVLQLRLFISMTQDVILQEKEFVKLKIVYESLRSLFEGLDPLKEVKKEIESILDPDGVVLDTASDALNQLRKEIKKLEQSRKEKLNQILVKKSSMLNENVIVIRNDLYCLPVKKEYKHAFKGILQDESSSGTTCYIEPIETVEVTLKIQRFVFDEQQEILRIMTALSKFLADYIDPLEDNLASLLRLDFIQAKAKYAKSIDANLVSINEEGYINLVKARHPLLDPKNVVPIDLTLDKEKKTIMITGPNTGGKTVGLKTVGLLSLMAQSGLLVPAKETSSLSLFDGIYADIGDEQSIVQSLSTFSSHMTKIKHILSVARDNILVLFDELGSGTDPIEGSALAMGILDYLEPYDLRMIVTTHYSQLKLYAYTHPHISNASVAFDLETLKPLYRINFGISGSSNALIIAERLGIHLKVIEIARNYMQDKDSDLSKTVKLFEEETLLVKEKEEALSKRLIELENQIGAYEQKNRQIEIDKDKIIKEVKDKADKELIDVRRRASELIKTLEDQTLKDHEVADLKYNLKQLGIDDISTNEEVKTFKRGDYVHIKSYNQTGQITGVIKNKYKVKFGVFELEFEASNLTKSQKPKITSKEIKKSTVTTKTFSEAKMTLDLRGFRYEEVYEEVDKFLDTASLNAIHQVIIIHGFGTGAVKKAVMETLKRSPYVKSHRPGVEGEGLNGVTVVTLK
ncbi:MAG: endonuclease MutS2 [Paracholeplasma sp.]|nr:endonuclease MutS2 [Paracholeplasma sp.]MDY3196135.1 endonuclease MutS2 [Paracholeplasma sp.]